MLRGGEAIKKNSFRELQQSLLDRSKDLGLIKEKSDAIIDSSGFETRYASRHYRFRINDPFQRDSTRGWPKVVIACDRYSHLVIGSYITQGPSADFGDFKPVLSEVPKSIEIDRVLADAGYDSEKNHVFAREDLKIRSTIIPAFKRRLSGEIPQGKYRKQMVIKFSKNIYKQRSQVECVFSRIKKLLSPVVKARNWDSQERECHLKILTFNLMLVAGALKQ